MARRRLPPGAMGAWIAVVGALLLLGPFGQLPANAEASLTVTPASAPAPLDAVRLTGQCDGVGDPDGGTTYPGSVVVTMDGGPSRTIPLEGGRFTDVRFDLPAGLPPGDHRFRTALPPQFADSYPACTTSDILTLLPDVPDVPATVDLDPDRGAVGATVTATGTCPTSEGETRVRFDNEVVGTPTVDPTTGALSPVEFPVPEASPGTHAVVTDCGGREPFEVLPLEVPATLRLEPDAGAVGSSVTATGTCPVSVATVTITFADESVATDVDGLTGEFGPVQLAVPDVGVGPITVETDCDAQRVFTVTIPTAPTTPPTDPTDPATTATVTEVPSSSTALSPTATMTTDGLRIAVPDLTGLTESEAIAVLGDSLSLAGPSGAPGRISSQTPPPGTLVEPASAVSVVLAADDRSDSSLLVIAVVAAALVVAAATAAHVHRRHARDQRLLQQVRTELQVHEQLLPAVPDGAVAGLSVRFEEHRDPPRPDFQEVGSAHD